MSQQPCLTRPDPPSWLQAVLAFIENGMLPTLLPLSLKPFQDSEVLISVANKGACVSVVVLVCLVLSWCWCVWCCVTVALCCRSDQWRSGHRLHRRLPAAATPAHQCVRDT